MVIGSKKYPPIMINQCPIEYVDNFQYLGSYTSKDGDIEIETRSRIGKAASVFQKMGTIWKSKTISRSTKMQLYNAIVVPTAIYACETWKRTKKISQRLNVFHRRCLRTILGVTWRDRVRNEEVLRMTGAMEMETMVEIRRRRMAGHILRMPAQRPASGAITWKPEGGRRSRGRPKKTWRSTFKEDLMEMGIDWSEAASIAADHTEWRNLVDRCSERNERN
jgi:hypothetical protein